MCCSLTNKKDSYSNLKSGTETETEHPKKKIVVNLYFDILQSNQ